MNKMPNEKNDWFTIAVCWDEHGVRCYVDGEVDVELVFPKPRSRTQRARRFVKLCLNRQLRRRLARFKLAESRIFWRGNYSDKGFVFHDKVSSPDELLSIWESELDDKI